MLINGVEMTLLDYVASIKPELDALYVEIKQVIPHDPHQVQGIMDVYVSRLGRLAEIHKDALNYYNQAIKRVRDRDATLKAVSVKQWANMEPEGIFLNEIVELLKSIGFQCDLLRSRLSFDKAEMHKF